MEPALLRMTWRETPRPAPWPATGRGRCRRCAGGAGWPSDVERLLDEAGQRAQEVDGAAQAVEETAAEEGEGVGGAFRGVLAPAAGEVAGTLAGAAGVGAAATAGLAVGVAGGAAYGLARGTGWVLENTLFRPQQGSEDAAAQDVRSANNMNDATQPQRFTMRSATTTSGSPASSRSPTTRSVALPQSQSSRASSSSGQSCWSLPPPSFDQLA